MCRLGIVLACLLGASVAEAGVASRVSVAVSARTDDPVARAGVLRLRELLTTRLSQEGFVVVEGADSDLSLALAFGDGGWTIRAELPAVTLNREVPSCGIALAEDQLEIVQKATALVRKAAALSEAPPARVSSQAPGSTQQAVATMAPHPPAPATPPVVEVSTGLDLLIRGTEVDPLVHIGGRMSVNSRLGLHLVTGLSGANGGVVDVREGQALAALGYRLLDAGRSSVEVAAAAGLLIHHHASVLGSQNRIDPLGQVIFTAGVRVWRHARLELRLSPGLSRTQYTHVVGNAAVWERSRFRMEAGVGLVFF